MASSTHYKSAYYHSQDNLRLYYRDYHHGPDDLTPVLCLHGLTRNSADFEDICDHLAPQRRVLALDIRGRGKSAYDPDYKNYQIPVYINDVVHLLAALDLHQVIVIGTSMGGLITMGLAVARPSLLKGVILNDIGPEIDPRGLARIASYTGKTPVMDSWGLAIAALQTVNKGTYPDFTLEDWQKMARRTFREEDGKIIADYDPAIGRALAEVGDSLTPDGMWALFDALKHFPTLALRGALSDILSADTFLKMQSRHPAMQAATIANRGHVPLLTEPDSLQAIDAFLKTVDQS